MILNQTIVEQTIDREERARFVKELVVVRSPSAGTSDEVSVSAGSPAGLPVSAGSPAGVSVSAGSPAGVPLAMSRRRRAAPGDQAGAARGMETLAPVLLVHGFGQNRHAWHLPSRSFSNYLARAGFDVFNLDLRGHGRSRHLGALRTSQVADYVREDIPAAVREISRISGGQPLFYIGHSMGGLIGYAAAEALGASLAGLVTLGSPYQFGRGSWPLTVASQLVLRMDALVTLPERAAASLRPLGEAMRLLRGFVESPVFPIRPYAAGSMEPAILGQHLSLAMDAGSFAVLKNLFRDGVESRRTGHRRGGITGYADGFERSSVPLLVIAGTKDELAPPASVYPAYEASRARDRTYRKFPLGHIDLIVGRDAPLSVWPLIESWIRKRVVRAAT